LVANLQWLKILKIQKGEGKERNHFWHQNPKKKALYKKNTTKKKISDRGQSSNVL
jgi:hypothetical protein